MDHKINISLTGLTVENLEDIRKKLEKILEIGRITNNEAYNRNLEYSEASGPNLRRINVSGRFYPDIIYDVDDFVKGSDGYKLMLGTKEYKHDEIKLD